MSEHDDLLDDMAAAIRALRGWLMMMAEDHDDLDAGALDELLRRYRELRDES